MTDRPVRRVALLGSGVIGGGWAARFLLAGVDVALFDPAPGGRDIALTALERARRAWARLTTATPPPAGELTVAATVAEAVAGAELVQESAPEREALKLELLAEADAAADPDAIIASSTSGLLPSRLVAGMGRAERFIVAHPFNPVYLLPLVELCAAPATTPRTVERAASIYRGVGMRPLVVRREVDGFIADRLLEALWREALWLVADDVATTEEIDDAVRFGPGLRWSAMGTFLTYRLAGGEGGMRHFMSQFAPALQLPGTRLTDVPELDDELLDRLVAQSDAQAGGRSTAELERIRDDCLVAVLAGLRGEGFAAGEVVADTERRWLDGIASDESARDGSGPDEPDAAEPAPRAPELLRLHRATVLPEWIDYNGHMTEHRYLQVLGDATDALLAWIGAGLEYVRGGRSYYTVESHLRHLAEAHVGDRLIVDTQLLAHDAKRLHVFHELRHARDGTVAATGEHMLLHVDAEAGSATEADDGVLDTLTRLAEQQRAVTAPPAAGRAIGTKRRAAGADARSA